VKYILIISFWFLLLGCSNEGQELFDIRIETFFDIPAGLNSLETHYFYIRDVPTRIEAIGSGLQDNEVLSVRSSTGLLRGRITSNDYRIIDQIAISAISSSDEGNKKEVYWMDFIPLDQTGDLQLFSSLPNVRDIVLQETIDLEIRVSFKSFTPVNMENRLIMNFKAFADE